MREVKGIKRYYDLEIDVVKQYVIIQENRFWKMLTVRFRTNVANELVGTELEALKKLNPNKAITWFEYSGEDEYKNVLLQLSEAIIKYGLEFLKQMSMEEEMQTPFTRRENNQGMCFFPLNEGSDIIGITKKAKKFHYGLKMKLSS